MELLTTEHLLDSNKDLLIGVTESGDHIELSSMLRLREFLRAPSPSNCCFYGQI